MHETCLILILFRYLSDKPLPLRLTFMMGSPVTSSWFRYILRCVSLNLKKYVLYDLIVNFLGLKGEKPMINTNVLNVRL